MSMPHSGIGRIQVLAKFMTMLALFTTFPLNWQTTCQPLGLSAQEQGDSHWGSTDKKPKQGPAPDPAPTPPKYDPSSAENQAKLLALPRKELVKIFYR